MANEDDSFDKKLDRDFLYYLTLTKGLYDKIFNEEQKQLCEAWLLRLCAKSIVSMEDKRSRNIYLSRLLLQMQLGKVQGVFLQQPPDVLEDAFAIFGLPTEVDDMLSRVGPMVEESLTDPQEYHESSRDGRTYIASRKLPHGLMAYMAVTVTENEPVWMNTGFERPDDVPSRFQKRLSQILCEEGVPISERRTSPRERSGLIRWLDKILEDCNKLLKGETADNADLDELFQLKLEEYKICESKTEMLKNPKTAKENILRDIRCQINDRRAEARRRELVLDQYEADEYDVEKVCGLKLNEIWLHCAKRPLQESVKMVLQMAYPCEVVDRFYELLIQERTDIIERGEIGSKKKVDALTRECSGEMARELDNLKKAKEEYKDLYCTYKAVQEKEEEFEERHRKVCDSIDVKLARNQEMLRLKKDLSDEIEHSKIRYEIERTAQAELMEKLEEAKDGLREAKERLAENDTRLENEKKEVVKEKKALEDIIEEQKRRIKELKLEIQRRKEFSRCTC